MENFNVYQDIASRTNGDIYLGVVGPVRTGKSTFITSFMNNFVLSNVKDKNIKERMVDELPQSADGASVMTTSPRFVPNEAINIKVGKANMKVRLVDCVGYLVDGATGHTENGKPRSVKTPWSDTLMPFEKAAEIGTKKVIEEHSTIAVLVTTDGTIGTLPRANFGPAETKIARELAAAGKPFVIVVNSTNPQSSEAQNIAKNLQEKFGAPAVCLNASQLTNNDVEEIFAKLLNEFPIACVSVSLPDWVQALPLNNPLIQEVLNEVNGFANAKTKLGEFNKNAKIFIDNANFMECNCNVLPSHGEVEFNVEPQKTLYYKVLSNQCGRNINSEYELVSYLNELSVAKKEYDLIKDAFAQAKTVGYGVVQPSLEEMTLEEPRVIKSGGRFGLKLRANAPSYHIVRVDVQAEVNPIVGANQSNDYYKNLLGDFETDPNTIWHANMFGKTMHTMVKENLSTKVSAMPEDTQNKMRRTLTRIVNEGRGGIICILL